jgi:hypothetical protein
VALQSLAIINHGWELLNPELRLAAMNTFHPSNYGCNVCIEQRFAHLDGIIFCVVRTAFSTNNNGLVFSVTVVVAACSVGVRAQPSPEVQRRISAAIEAASSVSTIDYNDFVNPLACVLQRPKNTCVILSDTQLVPEYFGDVWLVSIAQQNSHMQLLV